MFNKLFRDKEKEAEAEYEADLNAKQAAAAHEAELNARLAERLKSYNAKEDDSISNFSEINFKEDPDKTSDISDRGGNVDTWGQASPAETSQWSKENRAETTQWKKEKRCNSDRRQTARRKLDRQ
jgi:hypothetical protein